MVEALPLLQLPYFENISPELLVSVRRNEQTFEDFRKLLREAVQAMPGRADSRQFSKEVLRVEKEILSPAIKKLLEEVRGIPEIKDRLSDIGIDFATAALVGFVFGDRPLEQVICAGSITALSKALLKSLFKRQKTRGAAEVVLAFNTGRTPRRGLLPSFG